MAKKQRAGRRARGTGTIQRQRDGSYIARTTGRERSGRFPDRPAAEEALERWNTQVGRGTNPNDSRQRLRDFIRLWLIEVVEPTKRPRTVEFYTRHAGYATAIIGDLPLEAVTTQAIERCLSRLSADLSPRSINHIRAVLRNALNVAKRWGLIVGDNPAIEVPRRAVSDDTGIILSAEQVATLLAAVADDRLAALYHVALTLGLRRGELLGLRWSDVDFTAGTISISQQVTEGKERKIILAPVKTKEGRRLLPMPPDLAECLHQRQSESEAEARIIQQRATEQAERVGVPTPLIRWNPHELVFCSEVGTPILPSNFNRRFAALVRRTPGLPARLSPHDLRRTALTDLAAHGEAKAVQSIAGHADIDTTMRIYAGRRMSAMRAAVEAVEKSRRTG